LRHKLNVRVSKDTITHMADSDSQLHWYALRVSPMHELSVASRLNELGIEVYVPVQKYLPRSSRSRFREGAPLFPGYVFSFLNLHTGPRLYCIQGVIRILGFGGRPVPIEKQEIAMVRSIADSSMPVEPVSSLQSGDKVFLTTGPLAGISGIFVRSARGNKLIVTVSLLQRSIAVTVPSDWVMTEHVSCRHFLCVRDIP
jgi:transcriptional antiterminator NusG